MRTKRLDLSEYLLFDHQHTDQSDLLLKRFFPKSIKYFSKFINWVHTIHPEYSYRMTMKTLSVSIKKKIKEEDLAFYQRGRKETLICRKKKFNIYSFGQGPEVYLVHGWAANGARWKEYVEALVQVGHTAIVIDAPAHGTSPGLFLSIPDYIACLQRVFNRSENIHGIICHSIGALCSIVAINQSNKSHDHKIALMSTFNSCQSLLEKFSRCIGIKDQIIDGVKSWIPKYSGNDLSYFTITGHLERLQCKSLLIYDREDIVVPSFEVIDILSQYPEIEFCSTFGLGHNLYCQEVKRRVIDFIT